MTTNKFLAKIIKNYHLDQRRAAKMCGQSYSMISRYINNAREIKISVLEKFMHNLGKDLEKNLISINKDIKEFEHLKGKSYEENKRKRAI